MFQFFIILFDFLTIFQDHSECCIQAAIAHEPKVQLSWKFDGIPKKAGSLKQW